MSSPIVGLFASVLLASLVAGCGGAEPRFEVGPVDYATWHPVLYDLAVGSEQPTADWQVAEDGASVTQVVNADPSIFLSDTVLKDQAIEGTWLVHGDSDDDFIGFVFGYQDPGHTYVFDWKSAAQSGVPEGVAVKHLAAPYDGPPTGQLPKGMPPIGAANGTWDELAVPDGDPVTVLHRGEVEGWRHDHEYRFRLEQRGSDAVIDVWEGERPLYSTRIEDAEVGRFGFYNHSQGGVTYKGFAIHKVEGGGCGCMGCG
ncbi:MAG: hypothetical protein JRI25_14120 [Deltaproteobacteria bacterium]|nr:hypothetical protein [Deltaproteobacteria bacterium]